METVTNYIESFREQLSEPMPVEALKLDESRGFPLTSIKAAFVLERLSLVFGLLGYGWRYAPSPHRIQGNEILVDVALQWRVTEDADQGVCCRPIYWGRYVDAQTGHVVEGWYPDNDRPAVWSEPVIATGGSSTNRKGSVPWTDASRSATTNALTKAAGRLGVGIEIWKGQNDPLPGKQGKSTKSKSAKAGNSKTKASTKRPNDSEGFQTLTGMQKAAQAEFERLKVEEADATAKDLQPLAAQMNKLDLKMQPVRLLHVLLGDGDISRRRVMACYNFLQTPLGHEAVALLNAAAWAEKNN